MGMGNGPGVATWGMGLERPHGDGEWAWNGHMGIWMDPEWLWVWGMGMDWPHGEGKWTRNCDIRMGNGFFQALFLVLPGALLGPLPRKPKAGPNPIV